MQTPLVTNFSRGILSPKFYGRVETEIYAAGAAQIENFIVNNQGSVERRPGTYRIWNTNWTHPVDGDEDQFVMQAFPGQRYSLSVLADGGTKAQIILSTRDEHRYFELEVGEYMQNGDLGLFTLTEVEEGEQFFQEAHAFHLEDTVLEEAGAIVDDSFIVSLGDITFLRTRSPSEYRGYNTKVWHNQLSRNIAVGPGTDSPFVTLQPYAPPEYDREFSVLSHTVGATVTDVHNNSRRVDFGERFVPQAVGTLYEGTYKDFPERARLIGASGENNAVAVEPPNADIFTKDVPNVYPVVCSDCHKHEFYKHYPGRARIETNNGAPITGEWVTVDPTTQRFTFKVELFSLLEGPNNNDRFRVRYAWNDKKKTYVKVFGVKISTGTKNNWKYKWSTVVVSAELDAKLEHYRNNHYTLDSTIQWFDDPPPPPVHESEQALYTLHVYGGNGIEKAAIPYTATGAPYTINHSEGNVTGVTIHDELTIAGGKLLPSDFFMLRRAEIEFDQDSISRRVKPWSRTETSNDFALERVSDISSWLQKSTDTINNSKSIALTNSRLIALKSESLLEIQASSSRDYANFSEGDSDRDSYEFSIDTDRTERLQWMVSMREGIVVGTDKNEYVIVGASSPSTVASRRYTGFGSSRPYAIRFGDKILFVSRDAKRVFAYMYSDELSAWHSQDITSVAQHLFEKGIQSVHYQQDPMSIIWVVPEENDGLYALTWEDSTGVMAWTHHLAGANVLAATPVTVDGSTILILAVEREGNVVIEGLDLSKGVEDSVFYVDSAEYLYFHTKEGDAETVYGPDGEEMTENYEVRFDEARWTRFRLNDIAFMVDGATEKVMEGDKQPHNNSVIRIGPFDGADVPIEIDDDDTMVVVGIGYLYTSKLKTLPILVQSPSGAGIFKDTQVQKVRVRVHNSGAFKAGNDEDDLTRVELDEEDHMAQLPNGYYSGDTKINIQSRWMRRPQIVIESYYSDPLTVLALMVDAQVYE